MKLLLRTHYPQSVDLGGVTVLTLSDEHRAEITRARAALDTTRATLPSIAKLVLRAARADSYQPLISFDELDLEDPASAAYLAAFGVTDESGLAALLEATNELGFFVLPSDFDDGVLGRSVRTDFEEIVISEDDFYVTANYGNGYCDIDTSCVRYDVLDS